MSFYQLVAYTNPRTGQHYNAFPVLQTRSGHCNDDEICVDGLGRGGGSRHGQHSVASCISKRYFVRMIGNAGKTAGERDSLSDLAGKQVRMMASKADGITPMEVDTFNFVAEDATGQVVQSNECQDCMELKTDTLGPKIDGLRMETRLLTAGTVAGVLWLAILSG